jgi:hypothetical protein
MIPFTNLCLKKEKVSVENLINKEYDDTSLLTTFIYDKESYPLEMTKTRNIPLTYNLQCKVQE